MKGSQTHPSFISQFRDVKIICKIGVYPSQGLTDFTQVILLA
jgi:hypothetical protein